LNSNGNKSDNLENKLHNIESEISNLKDTFNKLQYSLNNIIEVKKSFMDNNTNYILEECKKLIGDSKQNITGTGVISGGINGINLKSSNMFGGNFISTFPTNKTIKTNNTHNTNNINPESFKGSSYAEVDKDNLNDKSNYFYKLN